MDGAQDRRDRSASDVDVALGTGAASVAGGSAAAGGGAGGAGAGAAAPTTNGLRTPSKLRTKQRSAPGGSSVWSSLVSPSHTPAAGGGGGSGGTVAPAGAGGPDRANSEVKIRPRRSSPSSTLLYAQPDMILRRVVALPGSRVRTSLGLVGMVRKVRRDGFYEVELEWVLSGGRPAVFILNEDKFTLHTTEDSEQPESSRLLGALALLNPLKLLRASPMRPLANNHTPPNNLASTSSTSSANANANATTDAASGEGRGASGAAATAGVVVADGDGAGGGETRGGEGAAGGDDGSGEKEEAPWRSLDREDSAPLYMGEEFR